jgi:TDG/mug DNA glycosylase family protein
MPPGAKLPKIRKPSRQQLQAARGKSVPDLIAPGLKVLFVGINPGLYSGAVGHHFARPGNRFWPALYQAGFSKRLLTPFQEAELLKSGYGITNFVNRATATANELTRADFVAGARRLERKVRRSKPRVVAFLGMEAYRIGFGRRKAALGPQPETIAGAKLWLLPNPSGLNASYQLPRLVELFRQVKRVAEL